MKAGYQMNKFVWFFLLLFACIFLALPVHAHAADAQKAEPVLTGARAVDASSIKVQWASDGKCRGVYAVYRKNASAGYKPIGFVKADSKKSYSYTDKEVACKTRYTYTVAAVSSENLVEVLGGTSTQYSSTGYAEKTLRWYEPGEGAVYKYLVFADGKLIDTVSASKLSKTYTYEYDYYGGSSQEPDFEVYALLKGGWGSYDRTGVSAQTTLKKSKVTGTRLVASKKLRIDWERSKGATGYKVYRRAKGSSKWKQIAAVKGDKQLYCYDASVSAKKTYYYTVKPYVSSGKKTVYASYSKTGKKAYYKSVTVNPKKGNFSRGSVYGPYLSSKQLAQVKAAVKSFHKKYVTSDMSSLEKVLTAQLYMARTCIYADDYGKNEANTAWGALVYKNSSGLHEAQCSGFLRGFKALCDSMGVPCKYVHANSKSANPSHQWTEVKISGKWYIVDPQANATSGFLAYFLCSGRTYTNMSGMKWDKNKYPALSSKDYPANKINKALNGYKVSRVYKKLFK